MERIRILLADDHPIFRNGLVGMIQGQSDMEVVGEAATGQEVVNKALDLQPDIILMDINMPEMNGIEATRNILHTSPHIAILVITMFEDDTSVFAAMKAGALGYILKDSDSDETLRAIRAVNNRQAIFSPSIATLLIGFFNHSNNSSPKPIFPELTDREREILHLIAKGTDNPSISEILGISGKTVRNHVSNIFSKLQVADRTQAIMLAKEAGFTSKSGNSNYSN